MGKITTTVVITTAIIAGLSIYFLFTGVAEYAFIFLLLLFIPVCALVMLQFFAASFNLFLCIYVHWWRLALAFLVCLSAFSYSLYRGITEFSKMAVYECHDGKLSFQGRFYCSIIPVYLREFVYNGKELTALGIYDFKTGRKKLYPSENGYKVEYLRSTERKGKKVVLLRVYRTEGVTNLYNISSTEKLSTSKYKKERRIYETVFTYVPLDEIEKNASFSFIKIQSGLIWFSLLIPLSMVLLYLRVVFQRKEFFELAKRSFLQIAVEVIRENKEKMIKDEMYNRLKQKSIEKIRKFAISAKKRKKEISSPASDEYLDNQDKENIASKNSSEKQDGTFAKEFFKNTENS